MRADSGSSSAFFLLSRRGRCGLSISKCLRIPSGDNAGVAEAVGVIRGFSFQRNEVHGEGSWPLT